MPSCCDRHLHRRTVHGQQFWWVLSSSDLIRQCLSRQLPLWLLVKLLDVAVMSPSLPNSLDVRQGRHYGWPTRHQDVAGNRVASYLCLTCTCSGKLRIAANDSSVEPLTRHRAAGFLEGYLTAGQQAAPMASTTATCLQSIYLQSWMWQ
jgi:hypothetical protein